MHTRDMNDVVCWLGFRSQQEKVSSRPVVSAGVPYPNQYTRLYSFNPRA